MDIRTFPLDSGLTVAEVHAGTPDAWHFLPFEDRGAELTALDERYVLAMGKLGHKSTSLAIFDTAYRCRTNIETNGRLWCHNKPNNASSWCYSSPHQSIFAVESVREFDGNFPNPWQYLRQMSVDGSLNRQILIAPGFVAKTLLARDDGRIVCVGLNQVAVVDPVSGEAQLSTTELIAYNLKLDQQLRWFSPDGRWGLRTHPISIIGSGKPRAVSRLRPFLSRVFPISDAAPAEHEAHPDLRGGALQFGRALDLFRLDPIGFERRLIIRYDEIDDEAFAVLKRLCGQEDENARNAREAWLSGLSQYAPELRWVRWLYEWIERIEWNSDGQGFQVAWADGTREVPSPFYGARINETVIDFAFRDMNLNGEIGTTTRLSGEPKTMPNLPSETALKSIQALIKQRSSQVMECSGWSGDAVADTLRDIRGRIENRGLDGLVFGGQFQLRFRIGGRVIGERKYFEMVRQMPASDLEGVLPELRSLLTCYGVAARKFQATHFGPIAAGPSEQSPAALSEAALTLAMLDDVGFDALRKWIITVDQEHDTFAASKVLPAVARHTAFSSAEAVRFGLWFFLQQWQTVKYEKTWFGLFQAAQAVMSPAAFAAAVISESQQVLLFSDETDLESSVSNVQDMLGQTFWDRAVLAELERLLITLDGPSQPIVLS